MSEPSAAAHALSQHEPPAGASRDARWEAADGTNIDYRAEAGWTVLYEKRRPSAEIFSTAYLATGEGSEDRPVTFIFNGGPGASSAFLHMGAAGPIRVAYADDGSLPALPPRLVPNRESWLAHSDLVFVDPVATGFSRIIPADGAEDAGAKDAGASGSAAQVGGDYFGYERDLRSLCEFMSRWLSAQARWGDPVFIAGESYGGYRVARLIRMAQEDFGVGLSGAILLSPGMEIWEGRDSDYNVLPYLDRTPAMALAAVHHGRSRHFAADADPDTVLETARRFAADELATLLVSGIELASECRGAILSTLADLIGLDPALVTRHGGRIDAATFARELLRDQAKVLGSYDATITMDDPYPDRPVYEGPDATLGGGNPVFTVAVNQQLRRGIGLSSDREYVLSSPEANEGWKDDAPTHFFDTPSGASDDFRYALALAPHLRVIIVHGRYDLVTPFTITDRLVTQMKLSPETAARISVEGYDGGHMFYVWEASRRAFAQRLAQFYAEAIPGR